MFMFQIVIEHRYSWSIYKISDKYSKNLFTDFEHVNEQTYLLHCVNLDSYHEIYILSSQQVYKLQTNKLCELEARG